MVGRVLRNHGIVERDRKTRNCLLSGCSDLNSDQVEHLIKLYEQRLDSFLAARGMKIFDHRRKSSEYISGSIKYEVLKRAKFHCELCGISAEEKALEVDHRIPRNLGGTKDLSNFQALCYS